MTEKLSRTFTQQLIEVDCPNCGMGLEVQLAEIVCRITRACHCCHTRIQFVPDASVFGSLGAVDSALRDLEESLGGLF